VSNEEIHLFGALLTEDFGMGFVTRESLIQEGLQPVPGAGDTLVVLSATGPVHEMLSGIRRMTMLLCWQDVASLAGIAQGYGERMVNPATFMAYVDQATAKVRAGFTQ